MNSVLRGLLGSLLGLALGASGCTPRTAVTASALASQATGIPSLNWLAEHTRPAGQSYPQLPDHVRYGSISGLTFDPQSGQWIGVIDERDFSRIAWLSITWEGGQLAVTPTKMLTLSAGPGVSSALVEHADLEAIVMLPDGSFLLSEEGHRSKGGVWQPRILHAQRDGVVSELIDFPPHFQLTDDGHGLRDNQGFESLTRTPGGHLIAGLEQPLIEDGGVTSFVRGGAGRLVEFVPVGSGFRAGREWSYPISATQRLPGFEALCEGGENGLVELLALTETRLLAIERACLQNAQSGQTANAILLFVVELQGKRANKTLLLDLSTLVPRLSPALAGLENFEALAFGPRLAVEGNRRSLLLASDDNFRKSQKTAFLLFALSE